MALIMFASLLSAYAPKWFDSSTVSPATNNKIKITRCASHCETSAAIVTMNHRKPFLPFASLFVAMCQMKSHLFSPEVLDCGNASHMKRDSES